MAQRRPKGEGNLRQHKSGLWEWRGMVQQPSDDAPRSISVYGKSRQEAVAKKNALRAGSESAKAQRARAPGEKRLLTVGEALHAWLTAVEPGKRTAGRRSGITASTWEGYENAVRIHLAPLHDISVDRLTTRDINEAIGQMKGSSRTVEKNWQVLVTAMNWLVATDVIVKNPAQAASPPAVSRKPFEPLAAVDVRRMIRAIKGHPLEALYYLALTTGARQGELLGLQWTDMSLGVASQARPTTLRIERTLVWTREGPKFSTLKTASSGVASRTITLTPGASRRLYELLRQQHDAGIMSERWEKMFKAKGWQRTGWSTTDGRGFTPPPPAPRRISPLGDLIFVDQNGQPLHGKGHYGVLGQWKKLQEQHGLPVRTFHEMRHVAASMMLAATKGDMFAVSKILGHADTRMLQKTYGHLVSHGAAAVRAYAELLEGE